MVLKKLSWYLKRLSVMSPREVAWRAVEFYHVWRLRQRWAAGWPAPTLAGSVSGFCSASEPQLAELDWAFDAILRDQDAILAGDSVALGFSWQWQPDEAVWHKAPDSGQLWPQLFFGQIDYRHGNPFGDARVVWEPARLQQLVALALLAKNTQSDAVRSQAIDLLEEQLISWVRLNPPLTGIHYSSAMECGLRIIACCHAFDLARPLLKRKQLIADLLVGLVDTHAYLISHRLSLYSSAGNHTIAEAAGLIYAGILFPELENAERWKTKGLTLFAQEIDRQILADGGGIEQAFWYLLFITDLAGLVMQVLQHKTGSCPVLIADAYVRGHHFLSAMAKYPDALPHVGDKDNGYALSAYLQLSCVDIENTQGLQSFVESGYSLVKFGADQQAELLIDHGFLGMPPSYGHGHADALSVVLRLAGQEVLVDPGTFTYTGDQAWRRYFRSTAAHNTIMVDGRDQAQQETAFLWSKPMRGSLIRAERDGNDVIRVLAKHNGYQSLGIMHFRAVSAFANGAVLVWDYLTGHAEHELLLNWHLGCPVTPLGGDFVLGLNRAEGLLTVTGGVVSCVSAADEPKAGWRSTVYGQKGAINTLQCQYVGSLPTQFISIFQFDRNKPVSFSRDEEIAIFLEWIQ